MINRKKLKNLLFPVVPIINKLSEMGAKDEELEQLCDIKEPDKFDKKLTDLCKKYHYENPQDK